MYPQTNAIKTLSECSDIQDFIDFGKNLNPSHSSFFLKGVFEVNNNTDRVIFNTSNLINGYDLVLESYVETKTYTDLEFSKYRMQPKRLSLDLYGTTELWSLILRLNRMTDSIKFIKPTVKVYSKKILDILNEILILESGEIKSNKKYYNI